MILRYILPTSIYFGYVQCLWLILAYIPLHLESLGFNHFQISPLIFFVLIFSPPGGYSFWNIL